MAHTSAKGIAAITRDTALAEILKIKTEADWDRAETMARKMLAIYRQHPFDTLVPEPQRNLSRIMFLNNTGILGGLVLLWQNVS